jgi:hypothetical protein
MPVYVRAGGIVAQAPAAPSVAAQPRNQLELTVFPHASGATTVYDDAGEGLAYADGQSARTLLGYLEGALNTLIVGPMVGKYSGAPASRAYRVTFVDVSRRGTSPSPAARPASATTPPHTGSRVEVATTAVNRPVAVTHDGTPLTIAQQPAVDLTFVAPDGLQSGATSTARRHRTQRRAGYDREPVDERDSAGRLGPQSRAPHHGRDARGRGKLLDDYDVTPTGPAPRNANIVAHLAYTNPDGTKRTYPPHSPCPSIRCP